MRTLKPAVLTNSTTEDPEVAERFNNVLWDTVDALEGAGIRYVFIGGIASGGLGRPRSTRDIDVFVRPEETELALRALAKKGFRTEKTDPTWLYKAFKDNILVDIIFKSKGDIYLDIEMHERSITAEFHGRQLKLVAPEDLILIKALAHSEVTPGHWHDAIALLSQATIDWEYLIKRARRAPKRLLSLLLYANSNDIWIPRQVIDRLYKIAFGDVPRDVPKNEPKEELHKQGISMRPHLQSVSTPLHRLEYSVARLKERIAEDPRTNELCIQVELGEGRLLLRGEVLSIERRGYVEEIARESFPHIIIENQIRVNAFAEPSESEVIE